MSQSRNQPPPRWGGVALLAGLVLVAPTWACGGDSSTSSSSSTSTSSGTGGSGGDTGGGGTGGSTSSGTGGSTTSSGTGGSGGSGGGVAQNGVQASDLVNAGNQAESSNHKMTSTLGQPTQNQGMMTSPSYRMQGGLIGAMGTLP